jgi:hypothetical protein
MGGRAKLTTYVAVLEDVAQRNRGGDLVILGPALESEGSADEGEDGGEVVQTHDESSENTGLYKSLVRGCPEENPEKLMLHLRDLQPLIPPPMATVRVAEVASTRASNPRIPPPWPRLTCGQAESAGSSLLACSVACSKEAITTDGRTRWRRVDELLGVGHRC